MSQTNVEQFASELGVLPAVLLEQLRAAGVSKNLTVDSLTEKDKTQLLDYLRKIHGSREEKNKISLPRRQTSEIKKSDSSGKARSIQVEVRKKRVLVKGDLDDRATAGKPAEVAPRAPAAAAPVMQIIDAAQQALREEEARRQAELIARQTAELREKKQRERPAQVQGKEAEPAEQVSTGAPTGTAVPEPAPESAAVTAPVQPTELPQPQPATTEGTLHKPVVKPEDKAAKADKKKKQAKQVVWKDDRVENAGSRPTAIYPGARAGGRVGTNTANIYRTSRVLTVFPRRRNRSCMR